MACGLPGVGTGCRRGWGLHIGAPSRVAGEGRCSCSCPLSPLGLLGRNFPGPSQGTGGSLMGRGVPPAPPGPSCCTGPELPTAVSRWGWGCGGSNGRRGRCGCLPWASTWRTVGAFAPGVCVCESVPAAGRTDPRGVSPPHTVRLLIVPAGCVFVCVRVCVSLLGWTSPPGPAGAHLCLCVQITSPWPPTLHGCCCLGFAFSFPAPGLGMAVLGQAGEMLPSAPHRCFLRVLVYVYALDFFCALSIKSWGSLRVGLAWLPAGLGPIQPLRCTQEQWERPMAGAGWA